MSHSATVSASPLSDCFSVFPDDYESLRKQGLAYFRYFITEKGQTADGGALPSQVDDLIAEGYLSCEPLVYEDFLPVSAAGIFQSNLGDNEQAEYAAKSNRDEFEDALGVRVLDELSLYEDIQRRSLQDCARRYRIDLKI